MLGCSNRSWIKNLVEFLKSATRKSLFWAFVQLSQQNKMSLYERLELGFRDPNRDRIKHLIEFLNSATLKPSILIPWAMFSEKLNWSI